MTRRAAETLLDAGSGDAGDKAIKKELQETKEGKKEAIHGAVCLYQFVTKSVSF